MGDKSKEDKRMERLEQRMEKLKGKKVRLKRLIGLIVTILIIGWVYVYVGSHKAGISWEEVYELQGGGSDLEGHLGGEALLITEKYSNEVTKEEFEDVVERKKELYVYYYSPYCIYCRDMGSSIVQTLEDMEKEYVVLNVNRDVEIQERLGIQSVPMLVEYREGEVVREQVGFTDKEDIEMFILGGNGKVEDNKEVGKK